MNWKIPAVVVAAGALLTAAAAVGAQTPPPSTLANVCAAIDADPGYVCTTEVPPSSTTTTSTIPPSTSTSTSTTSSTSPPSTTTTTTAPPPTTTSTTMVMPTTTLPPTTLPTTAPAGAQFTANLESPVDFFGRFVTDVGNYVDGQHDRTAWLIANQPWVDTPRFTYGDHDTACEGPDTFRALDNADPDLSKYEYWCAPMGAGSGHVMTAFDSTGYNVVSFSPNQTMANVHQICWDINATDEGGGKWTNLVVIPEALYQQFAPRMDYVTAGFNADNAPGDFNIQQGDHTFTKVWGVRDHRGSEHLYYGDDVLWEDNTAHVTTDKMARYRHCVTNTSATTSTLAVARPGGGTDTYTLPMAIPQGRVRVIFQDEMYDPPKRIGYDDHHVTFHWDNVLVS